MLGFSPGGSISQLHRFLLISSVIFIVSLNTGINGFNGYYAYIFDKYCFLECAFYGNATYILPVDNWEILSQKTKQELIEKKEVIEKIVHRQEWFGKIENAFHI